MPREKLDDPSYEEETFEEQMDALGVEIVKTKTTEIEWYKPNDSSSGNAGLKDKVSVANLGITLGCDVVKMLGADSRLKIAVVKTKRINSPEEATFAIKIAEKGLKIIKSTNNSSRVGSKNMMKWLLAKGVKKGRYSLKPVDGGWAAVACKDGGGK